VAAAAPARLEELMTSDAAVPTAATVAELARADRFDEIQQMFEPSLRPMVPADALRAAWASETDRHGSVTSVGTLSVDHPIPGIPSRAYR